MLHKDLPTSDAFGQTIERVDAMTQQDRLDYAALLPAMSQFLSCSSSLTCCSYSVLVGAIGV
jgi:hypothetical protein